MTRAYSRACPLLITDEPSDREKTHCKTPFLKYLEMTACVKSPVYRGTWYWVDDHDFAAKRSFTFLLLFFSLAGGGVTQPPGPHGSRQLSKQEAPADGSRSSNRAVPDPLLLSYISVEEGAD